jgi:hypothetical protein
MLTFEEIKTRLADGGVVVEVIPGPDPDSSADLPGSFVVVTPTGGPGEATEGATDQSGFQLRTVGEQHDYTSAETLAWQADGVIRTLDGSEMLGARRLVRLNRIGSPPTLLLLDSANRYHFVCTYFAEIG